MLLQLILLKDKIGDNFRSARPLLRGAIYTLEKFIIPYIIGSNINKESN